MYVNHILVWIPAQVVNKIEDHSVFKVCPSFLQNKLRSDASFKSEFKQLFALDLDSVLVTFEIPLQLGTLRKSEQVSVSLLVNLLQNNIVVEVNQYVYFEGAVRSERPSFRELCRLHEMLVESAENQQTLHHACYHAEVDLARAF